MHDRLRSAALTLALLAAVPGAAARPTLDATHAREDPQAPALDERSLERERVLHLADGTRLRGQSRWVAEESGGGSWEIRAGASWRSLAGAEVARTRDVRELVRELERLRKEVRRDDLLRRVALADWMVLEGLEEEALTELDRVLRADPEQAAALALLARAPFALPEVRLESAEPLLALEDILRSGSSENAARRELAIRALREAELGPVLRPILLRELASKRARQRVFGAHALRRLAPGEELRPLLRVAVLDGTPEVRRQAALALRASGRDGVIVPIARALSSNDPRVRTNAAEALGQVGFPAAVPALVAHMGALSQSSGGGFRPPAAHISVTNQIAYVQDFDVEIAQAASIADPTIGVLQEGVVLDARAAGMVEYSFATELVTVRNSLKLLTGHDAGKSYERWQRWYEEQRARYEGAAN